MPSNDNDEFDIVEKRFLHEHTNEKVRIFLSNGTKLECEIKEFDDIALVTTQKDSSKRQLVYKTSIASIVEN